MSLMCVLDSDASRRKKKDMSREFGVLRAQQRACGLVHQSADSSSAIHNLACARCMGFPASFLHSLYARCCVVDAR